MLAPTADRRLSQLERLLLLTYCILLFGFALLDGRVLTTHEAVHCQNVREMLEDGDWLIPHYGGRPWLERPPLPHWLTALPALLLGRWQEDWVMRLAPLVMGAICVQLVAGMAALWYGRRIGLLSGLILASMREFAGYSTGPEADIFLCTVVTIALALFVHLEFGPGRNAETRFLGWRSWALLGFFVFLGLTNLAKGLFFGMLFILIPVGGFLLASFDWRAIRRYCWLWGWLALAVVGAAWPVAAYLRHPDIVDLWKSDYLGRLNQGYMREPFWYYLANLPWILFPWTFASLIGLGLTTKAAFRERFSPERFLWIWAVLPVLAFSIPQGKHHHYLLHNMSPWAVLGALGAVRLWEAFRAAPLWLRQPWVAAVVLGLCGDGAAWFLRAKLIGPPWLLPAILVGLPLCVAAFWWAAQQSGRRAATSVFGLLLVLSWLTYVYRTEYLNNYYFDSLFLGEVAQALPEGDPLFVKFDDHPLDASWLLFYLPRPAGLLQNLSFLRDDRIQTNEVYVISRFRDREGLSQYGTPELVVQSQKTRGERSVADRWTLFHVRLHDDLKRTSAAVAISPMQATGRAWGPFLE